MNQHENALRLELAKAVSSRGVDTKGVEAIASQVKFPEKIRGINPCVAGICFDFFVDYENLFDLLKAGPFGPVKIFPWGFPEPDLFHVSIEQDFAEIPRLG